MNSAKLSELFVQQFWQVSILLLFVATVAPLIGRKRSHLAYLLWMLVAVKCVTPPLLSSPVGVFSWALTDSTASVSLDAASSSIPVTPVTFDPGAANLPDVVPVQDVVPSASVRPVASLQVSVTMALVFAWITGVVFYAGYLSMHWLRTCRIVSSGAEPSDRLAKLYAGVRDVTGSRRTPRLIVVDAEFGPAAMGCIWPKVVLPSRLLGESTDAELRSILTHELAHVCRGDVWTSWIQVAASCLWWFHPLVWYMNRQIVRWREAACDEEVVAQLSIRPREYAAAILRVVESQIRPVPAMQIGMAVGEPTQDRLVRLMAKRNFRPSTPLSCWAMVIALAVVVVPGAAWSVQQDQTSVTQAAQKAKDAKTNEPQSADLVLAPQVTGGIQIVGQSIANTNSPAKMVEESIVIRGQTRGSTPLPNVELTLVRYKGSNASKPISARSDSTGNFQFPPQTFTVDRELPEPLEQVIMKATTPAGVTMWKTWTIATSGNQISFDYPMGTWTYFDPAQETNEGQPRAIDVNVHYPENVDVSGVVVDHQGKPLAGVKVTLDGCAAADPPYVQVEASEEDPSALVAGFLTKAPMLRLQEPLQIETTTDIGGKWRLGSVPKGLTIQLSTTRSNSPQSTMRFAAKGDPLRLAIAASRRVALTVVHEVSSKKVPNVQVHSTQQKKGDGFVAALAQGVTDASGRVVLDLPLGKNQIQLQPDVVNEMRCYHTSLTIQANDETRAETLKINAAAKIEIRVADDATGKPIALPVRASNDSQLPHHAPQPNARLKEGITEFVSQSGSVRFIVPAAAHKGYEIVNPMLAPINIAAGADVEYTFRLRKMKQYRPPVDEDNTLDFPAKHQAAVVELRKLGAIVRTHGNTKQGHCSVLLSQFWQGQASDLGALADLDFLKTIQCTRAPVPAGFRSTPPRPLPRLTDAHLVQISQAKDLVYLAVMRSDVTDAGLAELAACPKLDTIVLEESRVTGSGFADLVNLPLQRIHLHSPALDLDGTDLSVFKELSMVSFKCTSNKPVKLPTAGTKVIHVDVWPANRRTVEQLSAYTGLGYVNTGGPEFTDDLLRDFPFWKKMVQITLEETQLTDAGLAALTDGELNVLILKGTQFTDAAIDHLKRMPALRQLVLKDTSITAAGIADLRKASSKLIVKALKASSD